MCVTSVSNDIDIARYLRELVQQNTKIKRSLIWLEINQDQPLIAAPGEKIRLAFQQLMQTGFFQRVFDRFQNSLEPYMLWESSAENSHEREFFSLMEGECLAIFPIVDSTRVIGILAASIDDNRFLDQVDIESTENLIFTAGQALERKTFTKLMYEESNRLDAILKSIAEGTFFVDEDDQVVYCNPQVTELTGIARSHILSHNSVELLEQLAMCSDDPQTTLHQLKEAHQALPVNNDYYPIVAIQSQQKQIDLTVELTAIEISADEKLIWAGFIRPASSVRSNQATWNKMLDIIAAHPTAIYDEVDSVISKMIDGVNHLTPKTTAHFLSRLGEKIADTRSIWEYFFELYRLEQGRITPDREEIDIGTLIDYACDTEQIKRTEHQFQINLNGKMPRVFVDVLQMPQALAGLLIAATEGATNKINTTITLSSYRNQAQILISNDHHSEAQVNLNQRSTDMQTLNLTSYLGYHLSCELIRHNGGQIHLETHLDRGTLITITIPMVAFNEDVSPEIPYLQPTPLASVQAPRTTQTIATYMGKSKLSGRVAQLLHGGKAEIIDARSSEELLQDINTIRIDLIIIDAQLEQENGLDVCRAIRKKTSIPIIMLTDHPSAEERLQGYQIEIDEYIDSSITNPEIKARIDTLFNRLNLADRTSEPIHIGGLYINLARREVMLDNQPLELTRIEYDLLRVLAINANQVLEHEQLLTKVWGPEYRNDKHYLWVNISRLRKKIEPDENSHRYIHNRPGIGYMLRKP